jgi:hypothetical protein
VPRAVCKIGRRIVADYDPGVMFSFGGEPVRVAYQVNIRIVLIGRNNFAPNVLKES